MQNSPRNRAETCYAISNMSDAEITARLMADEEGVTRLLMDVLFDDGEYDEDRFDFALQ